MKTRLGLLGFALSVGALWAGSYKVLPPLLQGNLAVFPVVNGGATANTSFFLTLDEGVRSGEVVITETGRVSGMVRPPGRLVDPGINPHLPPPRVPVDPGIWRELDPGIWQELNTPSAQVNELSLVNNSSRPLLLLAGEIVTGGKQDRVVGKDRIVPAHSKPVPLGVFCVEPHRWTEMSNHFNSFHAMAAKIDTVVEPLERSYDELIQKLRAEKAVGAVVAVNGEIIWADVFASTDLLNRYWGKLVRSYAAESFEMGRGGKFLKTPSTQEGQSFLDSMGATHETVETEPEVYRQTEIRGDDYTGFVLTSLLPGKEFMVHLAKMRK